MPYIFQYPLSAVFYIAFGLLIVIASRLADEKNSIYGLIFIVLVMSVVSGLRGYSVGTDTNAYVNYYLTLQSDFFEIGYVLLIRFLMLAGNVQLTLTCVSFLTYGLFVWRLWLYRKEFDFAVSMAAFMGLVFFAPWNGQRFYIAVAIVFFATYYLFEGKLGRYLLLIVLAFTFHKTAICCVALIPLRLLWLRELDRGKRNRLVWTSIGSILVAAFVIVYLYSTGQFERYFTTYEASETGAVGGSWYVFILIMLLTCNYLILARRIARPESRLVVAVNVLSVIYLISTILTYSVPGIGRLPQYLTPIACLSLA